MDILTPHGDKLTTHCDKLTQYGDKLTQHGGWIYDYTGFFAVHILLRLILKKYVESLFFNKDVLVRKILCNRNFGEGELQSALRNLYDLPKSIHSLQLMTDLTKNISRKFVRICCRIFHPSFCLSIVKIISILIVRNP